MNRCLICFGLIQETLNHNHVCNRCLSKFKILEKVIFIEGVEVFILYEYNDFFKELLYRYKGCYDYYLKDAFLNNHLFKLKRKYKNRTIICAPSFIEDDKKRGFNHIKEIAKIFNFKICDCLIKIKNYKQSSMSFKKRKEITKVIKIDKTKVNDIKKVLIIDDVTTSLSTIKTIIRLLPTNIDKKVLVLASNCRFMGNETN